MKPISIEFDGYTDEQWAAIVAARDDWQPGIDWAEIRSELEENGRRFGAGRASRPAHPRRELQELRRKIERIKVLEPHAPEHLATELKLWRQRLEKDIPLLEIFSSKVFRGRADFHREVLYSRTLRLWTDQLGGELTFARDVVDGESRKPGGPCVRFLTAALGPVLGPEMPKAEGIADIIKRERGGGFSRYVRDLVDLFMPTSRTTSGAFRRPNF